MSISIVKDDRLWGLIACHHTQSCHIRQDIRISCEVLARVFAAHIASAEQHDVQQAVGNIRAYVEQLREKLQQSANVATTLKEEGDRLYKVIDATGVAICLGEEIALRGATPGLPFVQNLVGWLRTNQQDYLLRTDKLRQLYPEAESVANSASGLISARIGQGGTDFVLWFRPAAVDVVQWAGNPDKPVQETEVGKRISPRRSFEAWKQTVTDRSAPWADYERDFAAAIRQTLAERLLVERNDDVMRLNLELERSNIELDSFAYAASHDLQEPVRTIKAFAQLLTRRAGRKLEKDELDLIGVIENGADRMGNLISALLTYGQVGGGKRRERKMVNLEDVLRWVLLNLDETIRDSGATVTHDVLPTVTADPDQMIQLLQNLVGNAIKYRKPEEPPQVHVTVDTVDRSWRVVVRDNGQGFDPSAREMIFGAFKRLHGREIPGTGIGLALCKRIVEHHGGRIWAESEGKGHGATLTFTLPQ